MCERNCTHRSLSMRVRPNTTRGDRRPQVVIADFDRRHASEHVEREQVALDERLLALGCEHAMHGLAGERHPQREHEHLRRDTGQPDPELPEVDLGSAPGR